MLLWSDRSKKCFLEDQFPQSVQRQDGVCGTDSKINYGAHIHRNEAAMKTGVHAQRLVKCKISPTLYLLYYIITVTKRVHKVNFAWHLLALQILPLNHQGIGWYWHGWLLSLISTLRMHLLILMAENNLLCPIYFELAISIKFLIFLKKRPCCFSVTTQIIYASSHFWYRGFCLFFFLTRQDIVYQSNCYLKYRPRISVSVLNWRI